MYTELYLFYDDFGMELFCVSIMFICWQIDTIVL